jgi:Sec-independent protein translocase protein TatA/GNAT superfamily N-acetyltransferase
LYLSFEQLVLLLLLAFILFGPEKLPEYAAKLGRLVAKLRQASQEVVQQVQEQNPLANPPAAPKPLPHAAAEVVSCSQCHRFMAPGFEFCPYCGLALKKKPDSPEAAPSPYPPAVEAGPPQEEAEGIQLLSEADAAAILAVINDAAQAYRGVIPPDCWQEPYMPLEELQQEMAAGVRFWGFGGEGGILGLMGRQDLGEVTLIRHAYVRPEAQRRGLGGRLLAHLLQDVSQPVLVGTWAAATWAISFYQKHGFKLVTPEEKDRLLRTYWNISDRQIETSVVLADDKWFASPPAK